MKLFVFERLESLTEYYHSSGGLIVVAKSLQSAKKLYPVIGDTKPDKTFELTDRHNADVNFSLVFPDAGCC